MTALRLAARSARDRLASEETDWGGRLDFFAVPDLSIWLLRLAARSVRDKEEGAEVARGLLFSVISSSTFQAVQVSGGFDFRASCFQRVRIWSVERFRVDP